MFVTKEELLRLKSLNVLEENPNSKISWSLKNVDLDMQQNVPWKLVRLKKDTQQEGYNEANQTT